MLTLLEIGLLIVLGVVFVTQILVPAVKGKQLFPAFREKTTDAQNQTKQ